MMQSDLLREKDAAAKEAAMLDLVSALAPFL